MAEDFAPHVTPRTTFKQVRLETCAQKELTMRTTMTRQLILQTELDHALQNQEFKLVYQPIMDLGTHHVVGFEALLRWDHPNRGIISPAHFIPVAEESGLIGPIGSWVLEHACKTASQLPEHLRIAVNVSPKQLEGRLLASVEKALSVSLLSPRRLELEITESIPFSLGGNEALFQDLTSQGIRIALDDFGTGHSSLSHLKDFAFSNIKIDRRFVSCLVDRAECRAIVKAIIELGHALNTCVTAEGVESAEQLEWIRSWGCNLAQGFLFSRPLPEDELDQFLRGREAVDVSDDHEGAKRIDGSGR